MASYGGKRVGRSVDVSPDGEWGANTLRRLKADTDARHAREDKERGFLAGIGQGFDMVTRPLLTAVEASKIPGLKEAATAVKKVGDAYNAVRRGSREEGGGLVPRPKKRAPAETKVVILSMPTPRLGRTRRLPPPPPESPEDLADAVGGGLRSGGELDEEGMRLVRAALARAAGRKAGRRRVVDEPERPLEGGMLRSGGRLERRGVLAPGSSADECVCKRRHARAKPGDKRLIRAAIMSRLLKSGVPFGEASRQAAAEARAKSPIMRQVAEEASPVRAVRWRR